MDDFNTLRATSLWPEFPFLRVERRLDFRFDQPICFIYAPEAERVLPQVFFSEDFPPRVEDLHPEKTRALTYKDLEALVADGWRVIDGNLIDDPQAQASRDAYRRPMTD